MEISIFEVLGPVMIGPSSSHTAGATRLARVAAEIAEKPFGRVEFGLSGSFAKTCRGHGTDKALLAGALGFMPDDERIREAPRYARERGIEWTFYREDLDWMHENSVHVTFHFLEGGVAEVWGSSVGGGRIVISRIGDFDTKFYAETPTLLVDHRDTPGVISNVCNVLARHDINIAVLRMSRLARGKQSNAVFIVDNTLSDQVVDEVRALSNVDEVKAINVS